MTQFFQRLHRYPPVLIRLLARNPDGTAMTDVDIARMGCPYQYGFAPTWDGIPVDHADSFLRACGADPLNTDWIRRVNRLTKADSTCRFTWLQRSPSWPYFKQLIKVYMGTLKK